MENCYTKDHKRTIKSCNCILSIKNNDNIPKLCALISNLCLSTSKFKNQYLKEVVGASFATSSFVKSHNPYTYRLLALESKFLLCKHTLCILLGISRYKFSSIIKSYSVKVRLEHDTKGMSYNRLNIKELKT